MKAIKNPTDDPLWDTIGIRSVDFRPHFDGDGVNVWSCVYPENTVEATKTMLEGRARLLAQLILDNRRLFGDGDRFQIVLGWPESLRQTSRQKVKIGGDLSEVADIAAGNTPVPIRWEADPLLAGEQEGEQDGC